MRERERENIILYIVTMCVVCVLVQEIAKELN